MELYGFGDSQKADRKTSIEVSQNANLHSGHLRCSGATLCLDLPPWQWTVRSSHAVKVCINIYIHIRCIQYTYHIWPGDDKRPVATATWTHPDCILLDPRNMAITLRYIWVCFSPQSC